MFGLRVNFRIIGMYRVFVCASGRLLWVFRGRFGWYRYGATLGIYWYWNVMEWDELV